MYSPPIWYFAAAALITTFAFIARYWVLMPRYRVRFLLIPLIPAVYLVGGAAVDHRSEMWPLLIDTDLMLILTGITIPYGRLLRQAAVAQAAGRAVPQVPGWVALPVTGVVLVLIIGEGVLFR